MANEPTPNPENKHAAMFDGWINNIDWDGSARHVLETYPEGHLPRKFRGDTGLRCEVWEKNGIIDDPDGDTPAVTVSETDGTVTVSHYRLGVLHRDPGKGPALTRGGGVVNGGSEEYFSYGIRHRDPAEGPAIEYGDAARDEYWLNDMRCDRMIPFGIDDPSVFAGEEEGVPAGNVLWVDADSLPHRDPADGPAMLVDDGAICYFVHGVKHRDPKDGPAMQRRGGAAAGGDDEYWVQGVRHRDPKDGPAKILDGGIANGGDEEYYVNGKHHRDPKDGPAQSVVTDAAVDADGRLAEHSGRRQNYQVNGFPYRDPADGPSSMSTYNAGYLNASNELPANDGDVANLNVDRR